jgi:hypothetical protein
LRPFERANEPMSQGASAAHASGCDKMPKNKWQWEGESPPSGVVLLSRRGGKGGVGGGGGGGYRR